MHVEHRISVQAPPERIFAIYSDVPNWSTWDPDTKSSSLEGPFVAGTRGRLVPAKGSAVPMLLTSVVQNRSFTVGVRVPLFRMLFEHELRPLPAGTEVVHRASFSGVLAFLLGKLIGTQLNTGLPITLSRLKRLAETGSAA
jgi:hypothetical protein